MSAHPSPSRLPEAHGCRPLVIGLTGPIAAGKSTVAEILRDRGAAIIDADRVYQSLLEPGSEIWQQIVARFGAAIIQPDEQIDRAALAGIVFRDPAALADLEAIAHPPVVAEVRRRIADADTNVVVVEAIKLVESGLEVDVDSLWLVTADPDVRLRRLAARSGLSEEVARERLAASMRVAKPTAAVDVVIDNSGDMSHVARAVSAAWQSLPVPVGAGTRERSAPEFESKENA